MEKDRGPEKVASARFAAYSVFGREYDVPPGLSMDELYKEAKFQGVTANVFEALNRKKVPIEKEIYNRFFAASTKLSFTNTEMLDIQDKAVSILENAGIKYCIIKGAGISRLYPDPLSRMSADIDILVGKDDYTKANESFSKAGYSGTESIIHTSYKIDGREIELHRIINGVPQNDIGKEIEKEFSNISGICEKAELYGHVFNVPKPGYTAVILLLHMYEHMIASGIGYRHLTDFAVFADRYLNEKKSNDVSAITEMLGKFGILGFASIMTDVCCREFSLDKSGFSWMNRVCDDKLYEDIISDIYDGGIYGKKKMNERYFSEIVVREENNKKSAIGRILSNYHAAARRAMPIAEKFKPLYVVAYVYLPIRYLLRVVSGKRKAINPVKMVSSSNKRYEIYKKFNMFEK